MSVLRFGMGLLLALTFVNAECPAKPVPKSSVQMQPFGAIASGEKTDLYVLTNSRGMTVAITNYGATVVSIKVPDRAGKFADVVLGYETALRTEVSHSPGKRIRCPKIMGRTRCMVDC
jgi:hypothetical protein